MRDCNSFYWYDLETFGIETRYDRIAQFAGIRTDLDLNVIGEPDMFYCQPTFDYLPSGESVLVTGITPQLCQKKGMVEHAFVERIQSIFSRANTCVVGYNSVRFDDECIRSLFYRNLVDPYSREYSNGNSRWDLIDMVRATYALRPDGINWPLREDGQPSFRLEDLTKANGLTHKAAHDALSDVEATIQMAALIKQKQPKLFEYGLKLRDKRYVQGLLRWSELAPIVHVSGMVPAERGCVSLFVPLAEHPTNSNGVICYDLYYPPEDLLTLSATEIAERVYTAQADLPEGQKRIHLKTIHINKIPFVAPAKIMEHTNLDRLGLDIAVCRQHIDAIKAFAKNQHQALMSKVQSVFNREYETNNEDVDSLIYNGFFSSQDRRFFEQVRHMKAIDMPWQDEDMSELKDKRGPELIRRYRARNFPESLSGTEKQQWLAACRQRLTDKHGENWHRWFTQITKLKEQLSEPEKLQLMDDLESYARHHSLLGL